MRSESEFPFVADLPKRVIRFSLGQRQAFAGLGLRESDLSAVERASGLAYEESEAEEAKEVSGIFPLAILHYRRHGESILGSLGWCFEPIAARNWPDTVGADSLFGKARCDVEKFEISNIYRPFYSRLFAARIKRHGNARDAGRISVSDSWADYLVRANWPPITTGEDE